MRNILIGIVIGIFISALGFGIFFNKEPSREETVNVKDIYYHGFYDECARVTIKDLDTGKVINRSPERCAGIMKDVIEHGFFEKYYPTPSPYLVAP